MRVGRGDVPLHCGIVAVTLSLLLLLQSCKGNWVKIRFPEKVPWCNPTQLRPSPKPYLKMTNTLSLVPSPASTAVKRLLRRLLVLFGWDFIQQ